MLYLHIVQLSKTKVPLPELMQKMKDIELIFPLVKNYLINMNNYR